MTNWPEGEDFLTLVSQAVKDRRSHTGVMMRDRLGGEEIVARTIAALEALVQRIDGHLEHPSDEERRRRQEMARDRMYEWLVWYQQVAELLRPESDG